MKPDLLWGSVGCAAVRPGWAGGRARAAPCSYLCYHRTAQAALPRIPSTPLQVYLATCFDARVAVKVLLGSGAAIVSEHDVEAASQQAQALLRELEGEAAVMASLRHTNVVALLGLCRQPPALITGRGRVATAGSTGELLARRCGPASAHALQAACRASLHPPPLPQSTVRGEGWTRCWRKRARTRRLGRS